MGIWDTIRQGFGQAKGTIDGAIGGLFKDGQRLTPQQAGFTPGMPGYQDLMNEVGQMQQQGGYYDQQYQDYINGLRDMAQGRGTSLAEQQYKQASADAGRQVSTLAASGRGPAGMAQRQAMQQQAQIGTGLAQGSAQARLQEQMMAQQQLGGAIQGADASRQQRELELMKLKYGLSDAEASNLLGYYGALSGQTPPKGTGEKILGGISALGGLFGAGG